MTQEPILLKLLLTERHWQKYSTFCAEYDKAAREIDADLVGTWPSRAQLHRWLSGRVASLPYPDHCRVLEVMFKGWTARELFQSGIANERPAGADVTIRATSTATQPDSAEFALGGVVGAFATRSELAFALPLSRLLDQAKSVISAGISLNLICQQYPISRVRSLIESGATLVYLFLDPDGEGTRLREAEEGYREGELAALTKLNLGTVLRMRDSLDTETQSRVEIGTYDEIARHSIMIVNQERCIAQTYLPTSRGIDSPAFVIDRIPSRHGLFEVYNEMTLSLKSRSKLL